MTSEEQLAKARAFVRRIQRRVKTRDRDGHIGYSILGPRNKGIGFVRFNRRGDYTVYILTDERHPDPDGRFIAQRQNPKDRHYIFLEDDNEATAYAVRAIERTFDLAQGAS